MGMIAHIYDRGGDAEYERVDTPSPRMMNLNTILLDQREMVADLQAKLLELDRTILPSVNDSDRSANKRDESNMINFAAGTTDLLRECHTVLNNIMTNIIGG